MSLKNLKTALGKLRALLATGLTLFAFTAAAENATKVWTTNQINSARVELKSFTIARVANDYTRIMAAHDVDHQALLRRLSALENRQGSPVSTTTLDALENRLSVKIQSAREQLSDLRRKVRSLEKVDPFDLSLSKNNWTIERHPYVAGKCQNGHSDQQALARWWVWTSTGADKTVVLLRICTYGEVWNGTSAAYTVSLHPAGEGNSGRYVPYNTSSPKYAKVWHSSFTTTINPKKAGLSSSQLETAAQWLLDNEVQ